MRAWRAAESSPKCTRCRARLALRWLEGGLGLEFGRALGAGWSVLVVAVVSNSCCHSPSWNSWILLLQTSFGRVRVPGGLCKRSLGKRSQSVHARVCSCSVRAAWICSRLKCKAVLTRPRMNCGGVAKVATRCLNVSRRLIWSKVRSALRIAASLLLGGAGLRWGLLGGPV